MEQVWNSDSISFLSVIFLFVRLCVTVPVLLQYDESLTTSPKEG